MKTSLSVGCLAFLMFACQSGTEDTIPAIESGKKLSHTPTGIIHVAAAKVDIDFGCDEIMAMYIHSDHGRAAIDTIYTRGELIRFYEQQHPAFGYMFSSMGYDYENEYIFSKLEYLLAQECCQKNCNSQTRKTVLQIAINKQKRKYVEYTNSYATRQTGVFFMAVILVMENDADFIAAVHENTDFQQALQLTQHIRTDQEFADTLIRYAESFLYNN
jgi:hypothetical protein